MKRRSRMSMHALLPPSMFKNGGTVPRPHGYSAGPRNKLRKTRSIPDMFGVAASTSSSSVTQQGMTSTITGRAHSHSVTGADMIRMPYATVEVPVRPNGDIFGDVMHWTSPLSSASTSYSTQSLFLPGDASTSGHELPSKSPAIIVLPFGHGVLFDSPSRRPTPDHLPAPHILREMQSFESGLTARQDDPETSPRQKGKPSESVVGSHSDKPDHLPSLPQRTSATLISKEVERRQSKSFSPSPATSMHSRYSTDVFDVLQTYRGLPLLDKLLPDSGETTVIKMSLDADDTAAPRDDPRFVIWGEIQSERDRDDLSISHGSFTDLSSSVHSSNISRTRSSKGKSAKPPELPSLRVTSGTRKVIVAATIERWIAQLTSDLNYDELLNFFLTYRTYISALDLCHLLICRFHWALGQHTSSHDEMVRRIVRVRTFVAIRYWLLTFFSVDFLPNRELRLLLANWLNTLIRDPILKRHSDGLVSPSSPIVFL